MISEIFKEILLNYPIESKKDFKGNDFASKMRNDFTESFDTFVNDISKVDNYDVKISPGTMGTWTKNPWAGLRNKRYYYSFKEGFYIIYVFDFDKNGVNLLLTQGSNDPSEKIRIEFSKKLIETLNDSSFNIPNGFVFDENTYYEDDILSKFYKLNDFDEKQFKNDLSQLIKIYEYLIPKYNDLLFDLEVPPSDLRQDDGVRIWRISPGSYEDADDAWNDFKKNSYVGVGFSREDEERDFSKFKNKWQFKQYLTPELSNPTVSTNMIWKFVKWIRKGDIIVTNKGRSNLAGIGIVRSDYIPKQQNEHINEFGLNEIYNVDWIFTPDDLKIKKNIFARHTLVDWGNHPRKWNEMLCCISKTNDELRDKILNFIFESCQEYINSESGENHEKFHNQEKEHINKVWNELSPTDADAIWESLIDRPVKLHKEGVQSIKSSIQGKFNYSDNEINQVAILFYEVIEKLLKTEDIEEKKRILDEYNQNKFSKGFGSNRLSSVLHYLDDYYTVINKKSILTVSLLSLILGDEIKLDTSLTNYLENNIKYKNFLEKFRKISDFKDFYTFDLLCHWMCDSHYGNYASENGNFLPHDFLKIHKDEKKVKIEEKYKSLVLTPVILESKLQGFAINENNVNQLCASLNAGKHIILDGTPGTGKTDLAIKFSKVASDNNFIDGFILTTATSDWSTFDTIGGLMPTNDGSLEFHQGKFLEAIAENKWLIIDEINRADIDKAFGQLFTVLSGQNIELPFKINGKSIKIKIWDEYYCKFDEKTATYYIGQNWRIIGTMNVDDKDSLFDLSYAFMRRFMFIEVDLPQKDEYIKLIELWANDLDEYYSKMLVNLYGLVNYRKLGPAIFKDMIDYIKFRSELDSRNKELILSESISSYIIPQFEGLNKAKLSQIKEFFDELEILSYLQEQLDELLPNF
ncbi:MrcB family domain-containing protein [Methanobrevibacter millerae]|uniref:MoxR-like ATPase n=1 Tax=Methanobrevibacter millerae TaxID=230361 RepID=A0A1G5WGN2_9EURY|nr:DUF3578 domain-containing protein [Methanobrevibacter millerae]SDA57349.1 MoxR-like ATPase [Methanobrevibacter millerae]